MSFSMAQPRQGGRQQHVAPSVRQLLMEPSRGRQSYRASPKPEWVSRVNSDPLTPSGGAVAAPPAEMFWSPRMTQRAETKRPQSLSGEPLVGTTLWNVQPRGTGPPGAANPGLPLDFVGSTQPSGCKSLQIIADMKTAGPQEIAGVQSETQTPRLSPRASKCTATMAQDLARVHSQLEAQRLDLQSLQRELRAMREEIQEQRSLAQNCWEVNKSLATEIMTGARRLCESLNSEMMEKVQTMANTEREVREAEIQTALKNLEQQLWEASARIFEEKGQQLEATLLEAVRSAATEERDAHFHELAATHCAVLSHISKFSQRMQGNDEIRGGIAPKVDDLLWQASPQTTDSSLAETECGAGLPIPEAMDTVRSQGKVSRA